MCARKVLAVVIPAAKQLDLREFDWPEVGPRDMMLQVLACGICGSDAHLFWDNSWNTRFPLVPGHELVGRVAEVGLDAAEHHKVKVGDLVVVELIIPCGECYWCKRNLPNLCMQDSVEGRQFGCNISTTRPPGLWGGYAEYLYVPYDAIVHQYPATVNPMAAVFSEPLAVAVRAVNLVRERRIGDAAVVVGGGTVGLLQGIAATSAGFDPVILLGTRDNRLDLARQVDCADVMVNIRREDPLKVVLDYTDGLGAAVVFETAGTVAAQQGCFSYARKGGTVVLLGLTGGQPVPIDTDNCIAFKELTVQASFLGMGGYEGAVDIIKSGRFPIDTLVTHTYPLRDAFEAMRVARECHGVALKVVLTPHD